jgi:hypothetical protein
MKITYDISEIPISIFLTSVAILIIGGVHSLVTWQSNSILFALVIGGFFFVGSLVCGIKIIAGKYKRLFA